MGMMLRQRELIRTLLETACRSVEWDRDPDVPHSQRLREALAAHRLELNVEGVEVRAWVTDDVGLAVSVRVTGVWNGATEKALYEALDQNSSLVAGLLLWEWSELRAACASAASGVEPTAAQLIPSGN